MSAIGKCQKCGEIVIDQKSCPQCREKKFSPVILPEKLTSKDIFIITDIDSCISRIRSQIFEAYEINTFSGKYELLYPEKLEPLAIKKILEF